MISFLRRQSTANDLLIIVGLLAVAPIFTSNYFDMLLGKAIILAILAISLDLAWGYGGILSLGHSVFFGLGAYSFAIVTMQSDSGLTVALGLFLALAGSALVAALLGWFLFYTKSSPFYIGVVTLSMAVLAERIVLRLPQWTGGFNGLYGFAGFPFAGKGLFYCLLIIFTVIIILAYKITRSDFGKILIAVRDNEERAKFLGFNTSFIRTVIYIISGTIAGFAGALYAPYNGFVGPVLISFVMATQVIIWVAIGGRGRIVGAILGTLIINILTPMFNITFPYIWQAFLGLSFILVVVLCPDGLYSLWKKTDSSESDADLVKMKLDKGSKDAVQSPSLSSDTLNISELNIEFGPLKVLKGLDLSIRRGEVQCVVGPNGAGKTTLINAVTGRIKSKQGSITMGQTKLNSLRPHKIVDAGIARTFQSTNIFYTLSGADNLHIASLKGKIPSFWKRSKEMLIGPLSMDLLKNSGMLEKLNVKAGSLSHGDQQVLELSMILALDAKFLLLDEPTAGLTLNERNKIGKMLVELAHTKHLALLVIEHDIEFVKEIADRVTVLHHGKIVADGLVDDVTSNALVKEIYLGVKAI